MIPNSFWPENTDSAIYIAYSASLTEILEIIAERWPETPITEISITPYHIQTYCIGYDKYDSSDYTNFIEISRNKE